MGLGPGANEMIFVVGNSRSGTTMMGRILGNHQSVYTFEELHFFENLVEESDVIARPILSEHDAKRLFARLLTSSRFNIFTEPDVNNIYAEVDNLMAARHQWDAISIYDCVIKYEVARHNKKIACEQTPRYLFSLDEIFHIYPNARVVNLIRDPRDVMLSQKHKWRTYLHGSWKMPALEAVRVWANYHPILIAKLWTSCIRKIEQYRMDDRVISVKFEDVIKTPDATIKRICNHCGIDFQSSMLEIEDIGSSLRKDRPGAIGINTDVLSRWKDGGLTTTELAVCAQLCGESMALHDYPVLNVKFQLARVVLSVPSLIISATISLSLNISRNKNTFSAIRKRLFS
jgi:hypothetical protein